MSGWTRLGKDTHYTMKTMWRDGGEAHVGIEGLQDAQEGVALRRGMRSGIDVVRGVARRSCSSVIIRAVTVSSMQYYSQDHFSWDRNQLAVVGAVGNAPIPRWSIFVHINYEREGTKSKTDLFHWNDAIRSWIEGVKIL